MDYRDLLPFDEYLARLFLPAFRECLSASARYEAISASAALFEALRWLACGIDMRLISFSAGKKLIEDYHSQIDEQYKRFPSEFHYVLPDLTHTHLRKIIEHGELTEGIRLENPTRISMQFQMLIEMVAGLNANHCVTSLSTALVFLRPEEWEELSSRPVLGQNILEAMAGTGSLGTHSKIAYVLGGCLQSFVHLEDMLQALDYLRRPEQVPANDWAALRQMVHEIHGWRFAFENNEFKRRFTEVCVRLGEIMATNLVEIGVSVEPNGLANYVKDLVDRWNGLGQPLMTAAAR